MAKIRRIRTFLWFETEGEEAAKFYTAIFKDGRIGAISRFPEGSSTLGSDFVAFNGGPEFKFNESVSFGIECETQQDYYWDKLLAGKDKAKRVMKAMLGMVKLDIRKLEEAAQ